MELSIFAFNVNGLEQRVEAGFNLGQTNKQVDKTFDLTQYDIFMLYDTCLTDESEITSKFPVLQSYTTEFIAAKSIERRTMLQVYKPKTEGCLYGYKTKLEQYCNFVEVGNQVVIKVSKNEENTRETYIIPVYVGESAWDSNFERLKILLASFKNKNVILIGDFKATVGSSQMLNELPGNLNTSIKIERKSEDKAVCVRGRSLIKWCEDIGLTLLNGRSNSDEDGLFTCGGASVETVKDFCFIKGNIHEYITDFEVMGERWGSNHYPIITTTSLSFPKDIPIRFKDILAFSIDIFEASKLPLNEELEEKEKKERSLQLLEKYKQQVVFKLYFETLLKKFAEIENKKRFWIIVNKQNCDVLFGQNIKLETPIFVQNIEALLKEVIRLGLVNYQMPLKEDVFLDKDISLEDLLKISTNFPYRLFLNDILNSKVDKIILPTLEGVTIRTSNHLPIHKVIKDIISKIIFERVTEWMQKNNLLNDFKFIYYESGVPYDDDLESITQTYLNNKNVLYAFFPLFDEAFNSLDGEKVLVQTLLFKLSVLGMSTTFLKELLSKICLRRFCLKFFLAYLVDFLPGGITWNEMNKKFVSYKGEYVLLAETPSMMQTMIYKLQQYCNSWGINVNIGTSKIVVYKSTGGLADYEKWKYGNVIVQSAAKSNIEDTLQ